MKHARPRPTGAERAAAVIAITGTAGLFSLLWLAALVLLSR